MSFDPEKITFFAKTDARGQQVPFGIKARDRQRHMYVVGKTGMGKSTLLENMAAQDIQNGEGMAFIDPHGSAAETLLDYVPEHRVNDVIYFAPFDLANPISFNVMEDVGPDKRHLVVSGLMSTFKKIWVDAWSARMEYILTNALLVLIEYPDTTLLSVNRLFSDKAYRKQVVEFSKDPAVKAFWTEEFANYTDRFAAEALPAIQNKIGQFTGNPLIRNIIGQPHSSFDIRKIMDEKKILIMNLSKGLVGETNANLLGSMLTTRIYLAAMSRADLPVEQMRNMPNFYFYVDEFQSFANATFANILSEARKYHLNLIIAHQYIEQMEEDVRNAVFGNVGSTLAFRVGPFDAEVLETVFSPRFLAADLVNLGFAQIYLTLMIDGIGSQPFSAVTLPPVTRPHVSCREMVIAASRHNFTKPRETVEQIITDLHTPVKPVPVVKSPASLGASGSTAQPPKAGGAASSSAPKPGNPNQPNTARPPSSTQGSNQSIASSPSQRGEEKEVKLALPTRPEKTLIEAVPERTALALPRTTSPHAEGRQSPSASEVKAVSGERVSSAERKESGRNGEQRRPEEKGRESRREEERGIGRGREDRDNKESERGGDGRVKDAPLRKNGPPTPGLDSLRSVLSRISTEEAAKTEASQKQDGAKRSEERHPPRESKNDASKSKADLAALLHSMGAVATKAPVEAAPVSASPATTSALADKAREAEKESGTVATPQVKEAGAPSASTQSVRQVININVAPATPEAAVPGPGREKEELIRLAAEAERAFTQLESKQNEPEKDDPLAPKKLERMFRKPTHERSPFAS